ncbi:MAG: hypothetical protein J6T02_01005 [Bacteroidales bacterium]|nr:hypothetical protein [Bacteroidales bacterium]
MKKTLIYILAIAAAAVPAFAQDTVAFLPGKTIPMEGAFLEQLEARDSILIADQVEYGFTIKDVPSGDVLVLHDLPEPGKEIVPGVELISGWQVDTLGLPKKKKAPRKETYDLRAAYRLASFEDGDFSLPPIAVLHIKPDMTADTLIFDSQILSVRELPVDTATFEVHDIKGQIRYPLTFKETIPWILGALALAGLVWLAVWLIGKRRRESAPEYKEPAHVTALRKLDRYRSDKFWEPEKQKQFYSGVTDALREYMEARFEVDAMEMTTSEIFTALKGKDLSRDLYDEMKTLFERADFVKFAKFTASREDNAGVIPASVRFVTETYQAAIEEEAEESVASSASSTSDKTPDPPVTDQEDYEKYMPK